MGEKTRYLYGASVQGIQDFIFKINKLKEVVGASRIVEEVCTSKFAEKLGKTILEMKQDKNAIVNAAGNIKYIFDDYDSCQKIVRDFPKTVATMAPGITISQAVVEMAGDFVNFSEAVDEIERRLHIQRNKPMNHTSPRLMGIARSKETHLPAVKKMDKRLYDAASVQRMERTNNSNIVRSNTIIHADGNAMGSLFSRLGSDKEYLKKPTIIFPFGKSSTNKASSISCVSSSSIVKLVLSRRSTLPFTCSSYTLDGISSSSFSILVGNLI